MLEAMSRTLGLMDYTPIAERDARKALRASAVTRPAAVLVSPFLLGLDAFQFLHHLRRLPGCDGVPILLTCPLRWTDEQRSELRGDAERLLRDATDRSSWVVDGIQGTWRAQDRRGDAPEASPTR